MARLEDWFICNYDGKARLSGTVYDHSKFPDGKTLYSLS